MNIDKRIKELQKDRQFTFKLTEDIIDMVYRIAVEDMKDNISVEETTTDREQELQNTIDSLRDKIEELKSTVNKQKKVKLTNKKSDQPKDYEICKHIMKKISYEDWGLMDVYAYLKIVVPTE